jgi:hypothetical protein
MELQGRRTKIERWIQAKLCVVRVEVDTIIFDAYPGDASLEPHIIRYLDELQHKADEGRVRELAEVGDVYIRQSAA